MTTKVSYPLDVQSLDNQQQPLVSWAFITLRLTQCIILWVVGHTVHMITKITKEETPIRQKITQPLLQRWQKC